MHKAYSLLEFLICLALTPLLIILLSGILEHCYHMMVTTPVLRQNNIFELQLKQLLIRSRRVYCEQNCIYFEKNNHNNEISFNGRFIVKRPGYEILLHNVTDFSCDGNWVKYDFEGKSYEFSAW
ncbi:Prepilin-type cleavage/methylation N-terminal domain protein [Erysipelothrix tonsillarum]